MGIYFFCFISCLRLLHLIVNAWRTMIPLAAFVVASSFRISEICQTIILFIFESETRRSRLAMAPHKSCQQCVRNLPVQTKRTHKKSHLVSSGFGEGKKIIPHLLFCLVKASGFNKKNESKLEYLNIPSVIRSIPQTAEIPVSLFEQVPA